MFLRIPLILFAAVGAAVLLPVCAAAEMPIGTNFWNIGWHNTTDVFRDGRDNVTGENPWNPQFLQEVEPYTCFRFMDWDQTNNSQRVDWSERKQKDDPKQNPVAYEWMIDLCNRTNADIWITLPHPANWEYSRHLAELLKKELRDDLKIYVEYSNETWNGSFKQFQYCIDKGVELDLPGMNKWYKGWAYHPYAAVRHFEQFENVFGKNSPRLVKVLSGQQGNSAVARHHLEMLKDPVVNPNNITIDAYGIAPYFGNGLDGTAEDVADQMRADIQKRIGNCRKHSELLEGTGIDLIAYEGGQHCLQHSDTFNRSPLIYDLYTEYLNGVDDYMDGVFAHYVHVGKFGERHCWGSMEYTGQPIEEAHKYRALMHYAKKAGQTAAE